MGENLIQEGKVRSSFFWTSVLIKNCRMNTLLLKQANCNHNQKVPSANFLEMLRKAKMYLSFLNTVNKLPQNFNYSELIMKRKKKICIINTLHSQ